jgi:hypothetical protein
MPHRAAMNIPALYASFIRAIGDGTGMADSLLHVHAGMAVLLLARLVTRRSLATPWPLLVVCAAELTNELLDRLQYGSWRWNDTLPDVANTLFWPAVLCLGLRWRQARG